jgi:hypothetical protein
MTACLYLRVPKKGNSQVGLEPALPLSCIPPDEPLDMLLLKEKSIALWQTYTDSCKASEFKTGRNELSDPTSSPEWDREEVPSLQELLDADDCKTPKKVKCVPSFKREADDTFVDYPKIGEIAWLNIDVAGLPPWRDLTGPHRPAMENYARSVGPPQHR